MTYQVNINFPVGYLQKVILIKLMSKCFVISKITIYNSQVIYWDFVPLVKDFQDVLSNDGL
jgi:hypothetical protein